ncbi:MAG: VOC family protein [Candidatus Lokiarchaeota archaeon]|nr:VOC family protein [Candidatus Lokiarchaeota archaeon]
MFGEIDHIGFVFKNVEEAVKKFKILFGMEKAMRFDYGIVKGARFMIGKQSNLRIDLIEPQDKNSIFYTFLEEGNSGLHHIGFQVENVDEKIKEWDSMGFKQVILSIIGTNKFVYYDTTDILGHMIEFGQMDYKKS